jgi:hypothetical protein
LQLFVVCGHGIDTGVGVHVIVIEIGWYIWNEHGGVVDSIHSESRQ